MSDAVLDKLVLPMDEGWVEDGGSSEKVWDNVLRSVSIDNCDDSWRKVASGNSGVLEDKLVRELSTDFGVLDRELVVLIDRERDDRVRSRESSGRPSVSSRVRELVCIWLPGCDLNERLRCGDGNFSIV